MLRRLSLLYCVLWNLCKNLLVKASWSVFVSLFMLVPCYLIYYNSALGLGFRHVMSPPLFFLFRIILVSWGQYCFHMIFRIQSSSSSMKNKSHFLFLFCFVFWFMFTLKANSKLQIFFPYILFDFFKNCIIFSFFPLHLTFPMSWYF